MDGIPDVVSALEGRFDESIEALMALSRIPGVSAAGFDAAEVERSADAVAELLEGVAGAREVRALLAQPEVRAELHHGVPSGGGEIYLVRDTIEGKGAP